MPAAIPVLSNSRPPDSADVHTCAHFVGWYALISFGESSKKRSPSRQRKVLHFVEFGSVPVSSLKLRGRNIGERDVLARHIRIVGWKGSAALEILN
jgi:hypothetical protein